EASDKLVAAELRYLRIGNPSLTDIKYDSLPANGQDQGDWDNDARHDATRSAAELVCPEFKLLWCCHLVFVRRLPPMRFQPEGRGILGLAPRDRCIVREVRTCRRRAHRLNRWLAQDHGGLKCLVLHAPSHDAHAALGT